jgi:ribosome-binding factor A
MVMPIQKKNTNRIERVNSLIQQIVGEQVHQYLEEGPGIVTVSKVEASRNLKWAKVWISIIGGDDNKIMKKLEHHLYDLQGELNRSLSMKIVPRLQLFLDTSPRYAQHINELIEEIHKEDSNDKAVPTS